MSFVAPERLETERLVLRSWRVGEGAALSEAVNASIDHLRPWMPWAQQPQDVARSEEVIRGSVARWLLAQDFVLAVWDRAEARVIGGSGFHLRHGALELGIAEIGMWIRSDVAGQGLGQEALHALTRWGFSAWPWRRLVWRCDVDNHASRRVAEACGYHLEGIARQDQRAVRGGGYRDTATYALLRP